MARAGPGAGERAARRGVGPVVTLSLLALLVVLAAAAAIGSVRLDPADLVRAVGKVVRAEALTPLESIAWRIRLPRVLLAGLTGGGLAVAGTLFQGVFRNPLADPYLIGTASGAGFGAVLVFTLGASFPPLALLGAPLVAFVFALLTVLLVAALASDVGGVPTVRLILAGVVVSAVFTAATSFLLVAAREQSAGILSRLLGGFGLASWGDVLALAAFTAPAVALAVALARALDLFQLGERGAALLGLPVESVKLLLLGVASLVTAACVSVAGIIGFVGLMVPHAARLVTGPAHARLLPVAALWGAAFMVLADLLARTVIAPVEVPVGIVTALTGGPFFLWLLRRARQPSGRA